MTKEKKASLEKYMNGLRDRLISSIPPKHKDHPASFKLFLEREIEGVKAKLDTARLEGEAK